MLVTHTSVLISVVRHLRDIPVERAGFLQFDEASLMRIELSEGAADRIPSQNEVGHLPEG